MAIKQFSKNISDKTIKIPELVVHDLARDITQGIYAVGNRLPTEVELCKRFGVSRTSVREAIRMLCSKGMVVTRQRIGARVLERSSWKLLDGDVLRWHAGQPLSSEWVQALLEARRVFEPAAAEFAARRATVTDLARIGQAFERMRRASPHDIEAWTHADMDFHRAVVQASGNPVFGQLMAVIIASLENSFNASTPVQHSVQKTIDVHGQVLEHIRLRQPEAARSAMLSLIDVAAEDLLEP